MCDEKFTGETEIYQCVDGHFLCDTCLTSSLTSYDCRRYKMISQYTWPNFPTGDAEEGTKMLLEDRKLVKDVTFGKTKIFVRTPATLFELERARLVDIKYSYFSLDTGDSAGPN